MKRSSIRSAAAWTRARAAGLAATAAVLLGACSEKSPPSRADYVIEFPSTAMAASTETIVLMLFDVQPSERGAICPALLQKRASGQSLPPRLFESAPVPTCTLFRDRPLLPVSYGLRAVLAIGQRNGADFLAGCAIQEVDEGSEPVALPLSLVRTDVALPTSTCITLSDYCSGKCP